MENSNINNTNLKIYNSKDTFLGKLNDRVGITKRDLVFMGIIFLAVFIFRLIFVFSNQNFADPSAYSNLRQVVSVLNNYHAMSFDLLSYGGRYLAEPTLFFYLMALLSFGNVFLLKIIPEIFLSLCAVIVYLISKQISEDEISSFIAGLISGFIPIFIFGTVNQISVLSLALPLLLLMLYSILNLENDFFVWCFIICCFLLSLTSPLSFFFVIAVVAYLFLLGGGFLTPSKLKKEAILFSCLLILLVDLIIYKKALWEYGISFIWQNTPANVLVDMYRQFSPLDLIYYLGIIPLILGSIGVYWGVIKEKKKSVYLFGGFMLGVLLLLFFRLVTFNLGLLLFGIAFAIFSGMGFKVLLSYFNKLKISNFNWIVYCGIFILIVIFSLIPSYNLGQAAGISQKVIQDMKWANYNLDSNAVILGNLNEGDLITGIGNRKNVADPDFLLAPKPLDRVQDIDFIYSTWSEAKARELLRKYGVTAIYFSEETKARYNLNTLLYADNSNCFEKQGAFYVIKC